LVLALLGFLFGIVHESPLQQHDAPFLALQQAWAFLPRLVFLLQQDMAPLLQQFSMSQQASELWFVFCGLKVKAAAETDRAAPHARAITSALILFILYVSWSKNCHQQFG